MKTNKYTYEYDDYGVMCRYNSEIGEWEACECHCIDCDYLPEECICDTGFNEAHYNNPDFDQQDSLPEDLPTQSSTYINQYETECHLKPINEKVICSDLCPGEREDNIKLICSYCKRDEEECEKNTESEKNPVTHWMGGWGMSCDDCYYNNNPDTDEESGDEEINK
jgi:hypothetical protein